MTDNFGGLMVADFGLLVEVVAEALPKTTPLDTLTESLRSLAGMELTPELIERTSHRLAGNLHRIRRHRESNEWTAQRFSEWVPVQVMSVQRQLHAKRRERGARMELKVMAGTSCPLVISKWRSSRWFKQFARKHMGFSATRASANDRGRPVKYPYSAPEQYVTLRFAALVTPALSKKSPGFSECAVPPSLLAWNKEQLKYTFRVDKGYTCPEAYPATMPCHRCWRGYESCRAGKHRFDYVFKPCTSCGKEDAPFDPATLTDLCVNCFTRSLNKKE